MLTRFITLLGVDYLAVAGTLIIPPDVVTQFISIPILRTPSWRLICAGPSIILTSASCSSGTLIPVFVLIIRFLIARLFKRE